jgi:hypothetical protein
MTFYAEMEGKKLILLAQRSLITYVVFDYCLETERIETMKIKYVWLKRHRQRHKNKFVSTIVLE